MNASIIETGGLKPGKMGGGMLTKADAKSAQIEVTVIRANGAREELGVVSYWHRNPLMRWWWRFSKFVAGLL